MIKNEYFIDKRIDKNILFLDIETTGLSPIKDEILIINIAKYFNEKKTLNIQIINTGNEKEIIYEFLNNILGYFEVITFNGNEFEYLFLKNKMQKYNMNFNFPTYDFFSLKTILKHFSKYIGLNHLSRSDVEDFFDIDVDRFYDMKKITKDIKKMGVYYNDDLIAHSNKEIHSLIDIYKKLLDMQSQKSIKYDDFSYFLYDFEILGDNLKLVFKTDKKSDIKNLYLENGEKINVKNFYLSLEIFVKTAVYNDSKVVLYEDKNDYIPLFMDDKIIYQNLYYILKKYMKFF